MKNWKMIGGVLVLSVIIVGLFSFWANSEPKTVKVGVIASLTGKGAIRGESTLQGMQLALDSAINDIELVVEDVPLDQARKAPSAFSKLVSIDNVDVVIGPMGSNVALSVTPLVDESGVLTMIHTASAREVTEDNELVFRLWPTARSYADAILPEMEKRGYKKVAALTTLSENTIDLMNILEEEVQSVSDIEFVFNEQVQPDVKDYRTLLVKIKEVEPDALFINLFEGQIGIAAKQAQEVGLDVPFFSNAVMSGVEIEAGGDVTEGLWFPQFSGYIENASQKFIEKYGEEPATTDNAAAGHDTIFALDIAINAVGRDPYAIKEYLEKNRFNGSIGEFGFFENGDAQVPVSIHVVENGEVVVQ